jgi:hypothetical protein
MTAYQQVRAACSMCKATEYSLSELSSVHREQISDPIVVHGLFMAINALRLLKFSSGRGNASRPHSFIFSTGLHQPLALFFFVDETPHR